MPEDEIILTYIFKCDRAQLLLKKPELDAGQQRQFDDIKRRRKSGEPLQYILGSWDFYGFEFRVNPGVLIPRSETEGLVQLAIKHFRGTDILDLGTGSGNIAVTMAKLLPYVKVTAVDVSLDAIEVAIGNAQHHGVESRVEFINMDMKEYLEDATGQFDLIISNPPYIPANDIRSLQPEVQQEPVIALDGGVDGLDFYRIIINQSPRLITPGGYLMMEFGDGQEEALKALASAQPLFSQTETVKDLAGKERVIMCQRRSH